MKPKVILFFALTLLTITFISNSNIVAKNATCTECFTVTYQGGIVSNAVVTIYDSGGNKVAQCTTANNPPQCCIDLTEGNYTARASWWQGVNEYTGQTTFTACNTPVVNITVN